MPGLGYRQNRVCQGLPRDVELVGTFTYEEPKFIEGFYYDPENDLIYESYGLYEESGIRAYPLEDPISEENVQILYENPPEQFGEGLARVGDSIYQLTYQEGIVNQFHEEIDENGDRHFVLDNQYSIPRTEECTVVEGWGLTSDGTYLYMSDGSNRIYRFLPSDLIEFSQDDFDMDYDDGECSEEVRFPTTFDIFHNHDPTTPLSNLNELEFVDGSIFANILDFSVQTFYVAQIDIEEDALTTRRVFNLCYLHDLACEAIGANANDGSCAQVREFNGIAYHNPTDTFLFTGKEWPMIFSVSLDLE
ncbi:unnamed protein product [Moneuplotes crassus]|uniref:Uncharacterized protein n=1 Tax=Euplotes crassus TaxID=5936 RepID=A0AAD1XP61_EUPCR|nr:unnamed protein product [Moneuplotes crassus]